MTARLWAAVRWVGEFFDILEPEPPRLNCGCARADNVIVGCLHCDHATCERHRSEHACAKENANAR